MVFWSAEYARVSSASRRRSDVTCGTSGTGAAGRRCTRRMLSRTAPELEEPLRGSPSLRAAIETLSVAFPDDHLELRRAFGQGEWLAVRLHTTGTMTGPLLLSDGTRVPATGQSIEQDWTALVRFDGDRIAELDEFYDQLLLMTQLGLLAPRGRREVGADV